MAEMERGKSNMIESDKTRDVRNERQENTVYKKE
jgi:hypothetical protein